MIRRAVADGSDRYNHRRADELYRDAWTLDGEDASAQPIAHVREYAARLRRIAAQLVPPASWARAAGGES